MLEVKPYSKVKSEGGGGSCRFMGAHWKFRKIGEVIWSLLGQEKLKTILSRGRDIHDGSPPGGLL